MNLSKKSKIIIVCLIVVLAIVTSGCLGNKQKQLDEARAANGIISTAIANTNKSYPAGTTYTIRLSDGNVTFKNGNPDYVVIEYPNGTVASRDFSKKVPLDKKKKEMGYTGYDIENEYTIVYKNGSKMHFYMTS